MNFLPTYLNLNYLTVFQGLENETYMSLIFTRNKKSKSLNENGHTTVPYM